MHVALRFFGVSALVVGAAAGLHHANSRKESGPVARQSPVAVREESFAEKVVAGARQEVENRTVYRETYQTLAYPGGDVPAGIGVCTDLVIRAYRDAGVDLQEALHRDRVAHPEVYPTELWTHKKADRSIDHRRCQNLVVYFERHAERLDSHTESAWQPGDVIFFVRKGHRHPWHVGIIAGPGSLFHLYPPTAAQGTVSDYGPIHSVWRWKG